MVYLLKSSVSLLPYLAMATEPIAYSSCPVTDINNGKVIDSRCREESLVGLFTITQR